MRSCLDLVSNEAHSAAWMHANDSFLILGFLFWDTAIFSCVSSAKKAKEILKLIELEETIVFQLLFLQVPCGFFSMRCIVAKRFCVCICFKRTLKPIRWRQYGAVWSVVIFFFRLAKVLVFVFSIYSAFAEAINMIFEIGSARSPLGLICNCFIWP